MELQPDVQQLLEKQGRIARDLRAAKREAKIAEQKKPIGDSESTAVMKGLLTTRHEIRELKRELTSANRRCEDLEEELRSAFRIIQHNPELK